ncbi:MAG: energy transducer TonB [Thermodesulfobacteriota bacterium]
MQTSYPGLTQKRIILMAFLVSVMIHGCILVGSPNIFMAERNETKLRSFKVDLIRPPMDKIREQGKKPLPEMIKTPIVDAEEKEEATISLDTTDAVYHPYVQTVKNSIQKHWTYPAAAQNRYIQGDLMIIFRLERSGRLVSSHIARSSGYHILDEASVKAINLASPFPPFPESIPLKFLNINASFAYRLKYTD